MKRLRILFCGLGATLATLIGGNLQAQLADITQPGDPIVASSNNHPGSEGVANAIDNQPTKYLNFDINNTGFTVSPAIGLSVVQGLTLTSANDAPDRDPANYTLEGSYDGVNFTMISSGTVAPFAARFEKHTILFANKIPYIHYRLLFPATQGPSTCCMQISEVELLGAQAPGDVTQPGDAITASSNNHPGSEGVANAIDNQPTKYLNFDINNTGFTVTPSVGGTRVTGITLTSANDAPDRDPAHYKLEGSLDGTTFFEVSSGSVPAFPTRFYKNYIFFPENSRAFLTYRVTFPDTQGPSTCCMQISEVELLGVVTDVPQDVTQPGDAIIASSNNHPGSEGVANAIDNQPTKYLNFDINNTGFTVTPGSGLTIVSGLTLTSANDAPDRDPANYTLEGSYDGTTFTMISSGTVPAFPTRFFKNTLLFDNKIPYLKYRLLFPATQGPSTCCMQISEVELLGVLAPTDVTVPGDAIIASSNNHPGSEGVANAIDNQPTKYLNFDINNTGFTVTPGVGDTIVSGLTLTSANDAPDRDPAHYTLEGSLDGATFFPISSGSVPAFPTRFFKNYIFFPENDRAFKTYRLIFPDTQGPSTCCMQISEVELLGVTPGSVNTNEVNTLIRRQPSDAPVLIGATATFRVELTGPWKVEWYRNGEKIAGANNASYTTPAAVAGDDGAVYQAVVQGRDGRQYSDQVMLSIFTPSTIESIGVSWVGEGANGAPTPMPITDIAGFQPQAYWNNLTDASGGPFDMTNSFNAVHPTIKLTWSTSGEWGVGTGSGSPTERMLNGIATVRGDNDAGAQTVTLSGVPAGTHSLLLYAVQVPLEFASMEVSVRTHDSVGGNVDQHRSIRPQNSDEYNPSPGFILVTSETPATRGVGNMMRFDNLVAPDGFVEIRMWSANRSDRGPGLNAFQLVLNAPDVGASPLITRDPVSANAIEGGQVTLQVEASGPNLAYQWLKNGQAIQGATEPLFTLSGLTAADAGEYSVAVSNPAGRVRSRAAVVDVVDSAEVTFDLITYLKLDEADGDLTVVNSATGGQNGTLSGGVDPRGDGIVGGSLTYNGADTAVVIPSYPKVSTGMTVSGWVQPNGPAGPLVNNWVEAAIAGAHGQFSIDLFDAGGGLSVRGRIEIGANTITAISAPLTVEQTDPFEWHHFAMSANGATIDVFWDGELVASADYINNLNNIAAITRLAVGADLDAAGATVRSYAGIMDEVALWKRSLSQVEIQGIRTGGQNGQMLSEIPPILNINRSPIAVADSASAATAERTVIDVLANDSDPDAGDVLTISSITVPSHGSAVITNNTVAYTSDAGYTGSDSFRYTIGDGHGGIATAVVSITVGSFGPELTNPAVAGGQFSVSFLTKSGKTYILEFNADLNVPTGWAATTPAVQVTGDGSVKTLTDANPVGPHRFYRVRVE